MPRQARYKKSTKKNTVLQSTIHLSYLSSHTLKAQSAAWTWITKITAILIVGQGIQGTFALTQRLMLKATDQTSNLTNKIKCIQSNFQGGNLKKRLFFLVDYDSWSYCPQQCIVLHRRINPTAVKNDVLHVRYKCITKIQGKRQKIPKQD